MFSIEETDGWIYHGPETLEIRTCQKCRTPIINTYRYKDLVNDKFKNEINPIKIKVFGTEDIIQRKREELKHKMTHFILKYIDVLKG